MNELDKLLPAVAIFGILIIIVWLTMPSCPPGSVAVRGVLGYVCVEGSHAH